MTGASWRRFSGGKILQLQHDDIKIINHDHPDYGVFEAESRGHGLTFFNDDRAAK